METVVFGRIVITTKNQINVFNHKTDTGEKINEPKHRLKNKILNES
jgi:hypothetical protein